MRHVPVVAGEGERGAGVDGESIEGQSLCVSGRGERASFQTAGVSAASPPEEDQQVEKEKAGDTMEEEFRIVVGERR